MSDLTGKLKFLKWSAFSQCIYEDSCNRATEDIKFRRSTVLYLWHWFLFKMLVYIVYIFSLSLPGKVFWSSLTAGNSFTSSLSSLLRESQHLQSKFSSCFVCSSSKWKDFKCQPSKPGTSSQLTRILYTCPRSPVSTCNKYHEEERTVRVGSLTEIFSNSVEFLNLTSNNGKAEMKAGISVMREPIILFYMVGSWVRFPPLFSSFPLLVL